MDQIFNLLLGFLMSKIILKRHAYLFFMLKNYSTPKKHKKDKVNISIVKRYKNKFIKYRVTNQNNLFKSKNDGPHSLSLGVWIPRKCGDRTRKQKGKGSPSLETESPYERSEATDGG